VSDVRKPLEPQPGVLIHPAADRRLATEHWLLSTLPDDWRGPARRDWKRQRVTLLPLGTLFSAVRIPGSLILALTGTLTPRDIDSVLADVLHGGPVICDPRRAWYYALVPASVPRTVSAKKLDTWRDINVEVLGRDAYLGVPPLDAVALNPQAPASYWSVPMESAASLCAPLTVGRLIGAGRDRLLEGAGE
jgi:hypothetical protein